MGEHHPVPQRLREARILAALAGHRVEESIQRRYRSLVTFGIREGSEVLRTLDHCHRDPYRTQGTNNIAL